MGKFVEVQFDDLTAHDAEMLIAVLNEAGFEGFEEAVATLKAFIPASQFDESVFLKLMEPFPMRFSIEMIDDRNWNQVWESNFEPVVVDDFVGLRADFHSPISGVMHEIVITPKMSFGTGHHATTHMMLQQMRQIDFRDKSVFDFGTGTGVLAILASKLGAVSILAIDNDEWSIENAGENFVRNEVTNIQLVKSEEGDQHSTFDVILANINMHIILENLPALARQLKADGILYLSGLLMEDEADISKRAGACGLKMRTQSQKDNWLFMSMSH